MARAIVLLLDSLGVGASQDAPRYGDVGADTFGHIVLACDKGQADIPGVRTGPLQIPNLARLGLFHAATASTGIAYPACQTITPKALFGYAVERSVGKDTPSGHWEIAGVPVMKPWGHFHENTPCFPKSLIDDLCRLGSQEGVLANCAGSGTAMIDEFGEEHCKTGQPIVYTSADSVLQIAAHEEHFGLERLYKLCLVARELANPYQIGRVIARPFVGDVGAYRRTTHRRDYTMPPEASTLLDQTVSHGHEVVSVGKTADIFAHQGITRCVKAHGIEGLFHATLDAMRDTPSGIVFTNFVDFDSEYGHRRDVAGYAHALECFDKLLPSLYPKMQPDDLVLITADHGCDPTFQGSDHTREHVPVLMFGPQAASGFIGRRETFADMGQTIAHFLDIEPLDQGVSFW